SLLLSIPLGLDNIFPRYAEANHPFATVVLCRQFQVQVGRRAQRNLEHQRNDAGPQAQLLSGGDRRYRGPRNASATRLRTAGASWPSVSGQWPTGSQRCSVAAYFSCADFSSLLSGGDR